MLDKYSLEIKFLKLKITYLCVYIFCKYKCSHIYTFERRIFFLKFFNHNLLVREISGLTEKYLNIIPIKAYSQLLIQYTSIKYLQYS